MLPLASMFQRRAGSVAPVYGGGVRSVTNRNFSFNRNGWNETVACHAGRSRKQREAVTDDPLGICCGHAASVHTDGKACTMDATLGAVVVPCRCRKLRLPPEPDLQIDLCSAIGLGNL